MTVSRYSIVRYLPDPLREEYVNIGVVVVTEDGSFSRSRFLQRWSRIPNFTVQGSSFLKDVALEISQLADEQLDFQRREPFTVEQLQRLADHWRNAVQFSELRASVAPDPARLLDQLYAQYVSAPGRSTVRARDKRAVIRVAREQLAEALAERFPVGTPEIIVGDALEGKREPHKFDLVVRNGKPLIGLEGLSFEAPPSRDLENEVSAVAWALDDVRSLDQDLPLGVLVILPRWPREDYRRAQRLCETLAVALIPESEVGNWTARTVAGIRTTATSR